MSNFGSNQISQGHSRVVESEGNRSSSAQSTGNSGTTALDQEQSLIDDSSLSSSPAALCPAPVCRQFWKAGNYNDGLTSKSQLKSGTSYLHIHPKFLHSNATSHKWAFGAIAELLDNAIDEIHNGATYVIVDKTLNPRDGSSALLIQDDGGGMDPEAMRRCLSFGFSDKKTKSAIGQYGNGFKTSSMRLGADVIVFSRHMNDRKLTQTVGLLSYTFLTQTGLDRIVVPLIDFEFDTATTKWEMVHSKQHFMNNLLILLRWSPYSTEVELLKQFDDIGNHGTRIVIYNLWYTDEGNMELDFESDPEDIRLSGETSKVEKGGSRTAANEQHLANRLRYSLRAYLSILYFRVPDNFCILLRGQVVEHHNIATDLKFPEVILYKPQYGNVEKPIVTTIGFLKEAPLVNVHGFNVYHKNRLILPFWHVVSYSDSRGRGVVGVLDANFVQPTHNKQDFEKTPLFQKLEVRLKEMTWEYWDYHCGLIGYQVKKKPPASMNCQVSCEPTHAYGKYKPVLLGRDSSTATSTKVSGSIQSHQRQTDFSCSWSGATAGNLKPGFQSSREGPLKRKEHNNPIEPERMKRKAGIVSNVTYTRPSRGIQPASTLANSLEDKEAFNLIQENRKLHAQCLELEKRGKEFNMKVASLQAVLKEAQREYANLLVESRLLEKVKSENGAAS